MRRPLDVLDAIEQRRSVKRFSDRVVTRDEIAALLDAAVRAPNHRLTEPWRFYVLGPRARHGYGAVLGRRKARKVEDPEAARMIVEKVASEHGALPAMIAVAMRLDENPEIREEDYAATMMAVQNIALAAAALGLGVHIRSGAVMDDPAARSLVGVPEGERIIATLHLGEPAESSAPKPRTPAADKTVFLD